MKRDYSGLCVSPEDCSCKHGDQTFASGEVTVRGCTTCECLGGLFSCVSDGCPKVCASVGQREFLQFDGQWKIFDASDCSINLAELEVSDGGVEGPVVVVVVVSVRAVRCGSLEATFCSKVVSIELESGSLQLDDSEGHVTLHDVDESSFPEYH
uniref:Otogelin-like protein n=1 Tax=Petromyzon marinus TaxID=7757 RepID=A0AAJ7WM07_PETMA